MKHNAGSITNSSASFEHVYVLHNTMYHLELALLFAIDNHKKYGYRSLIVVLHSGADNHYRDIPRYFPFIRFIGVAREYPEFATIHKRIVPYEPHKIASWLSFEYPSCVEYLRENIIPDTVRTLYMFYPQERALDYYVLNHAFNSGSRISVEIIEEGLSAHDFVSPYYKYRHIKYYASFPENILGMCFAPFLASRLGFKVFFRLRTYIPEKILKKLDGLLATKWWLLKADRIHLQEWYSRAVYHRLRGKVVRFNFRAIMEPIDSWRREKIQNLFLDGPNDAQLRSILKNASGLVIIQEFFLYKPPQHLVIQIFRTILQKYFSAHDSIVLKTHRSKWINWQEACGDIANTTVVRMPFPAELINWYPHSIQKAVAIRSTALRNLYTIPRHIEVWNDRYGPTGERDLIKLYKYLQR